MKNKNENGKYFNQKCAGLIVAMTLLFCITTSGCGRKNAVAPARQDDVIVPGVSGSPRGESEADRKALVIINDCAIPREVYQRNAFYYSFYADLKMDRPDDRLEALIQSALLEQEAIRRKLDQDPKTRREIQQILICALLRETAKQKQAKPVTEEELKKDYDDNYALYNEPTRIRISHILITTNDVVNSRDEARQKAEALLKEAVSKRPAYFYELAAGQSQDKDSAIRRGDLGYLDVPDPMLKQQQALWLVSLIEAALSVKRIGEIVPRVVETEKGFHLVKYEGLRKGERYDFATVRDTIQRKLEANLERLAYGDLVRQLKQSASIQVNNEVWDSIRNLATSAGVEGVSASQPESMVEELKKEAEGRQRELEAATPRWTRSETVPLTATGALSAISIRAMTPLASSDSEGILPNRVVAQPRPINIEPKPAEKGQFNVTVEKKTQTIEQNLGGKTPEAPK